MNDQSFNPELADLLDYVEGGSLSAGAKARVEAVLASDAALRRQIEGMKADRAVMTASAGASIKAPANLLARVEDALERATLRSLAGAEAGAAAPLAVSRVEVEHEGVLASIFGNKRLRPVLAAAAILLAIGGTITVVAVSAARSAREREIRLANDKTHHGIGEEVRMTKFDGTQTAERPSLPAIPDVPPAINDPSPTDVAANTPAIDATSPTPAEPTPAFGMPLDRALALAQEGRLLLRVRTATLDPVADRLASLSRAGSAPRAFYSLSPRASNIAIAARPAEAPVVAPSPVSPSANPTGIASANGEPKPATIKPNHGAPVGQAPSWRPADKAFAAQVSPSVRSLKSLIEQVRKNDRSLDIQFLESPLALDSEDLADPASLLWWTSTSTWDRSAIVPIIIETP